MESSSSFHRVGMEGGAGDAVQRFYAHGVHYHYDVDAQVLPETVTSQAHLFTSLSRLRHTLSYVCCLRSQRMHCCDSINAHLIHHGWPAPLERLQTPLWQARSANEPALRHRTGLSSCCLFPSLDVDFLVPAGGIDMTWKLIQYYRALVSHQQEEVERDLPTQPSTERHVDRVGCVVVLAHVLASTASVQCRNSSHRPQADLAVQPTGPANAGTDSLIAQPGHGFAGPHPRRTLPLSRLRSPPECPVASARQGAAYPQGRYGPVPGERPSIPGTQTVPRPRLGTRLDHWGGCWASARRPQQHAARGPWLQRTSPPASPR